MNPMQSSVCMSKAETDARISAAYERIWRMSESEPRKRRAKIPFAEKLEKVNDQIRLHAAQIELLKARRDAMLAAHREAGQRMVEEAGE